MSREEATFISNAALLADTGMFESMSDLHAALRLSCPRAASDWLADDVWFCLASRIEAARSRQRQSALAY